LERGKIEKEGAMPPLKTTPPSPLGEGGQGGWGHHIKIKGFPEKSKIF
jgi:hypothetical protein